MGLTQFPYIQQYDNFYCGPACVQMMRKFLSPNTPEGWDEQYEIGQAEGLAAQITSNFISHKNWVDSENTIWSTTPIEIKNMLHHYGHKQFNLTFVTLAQAAAKTLNGDREAAIKIDRQNFVDELVARCKYAKTQSATITGLIEPLVPPPIVPIHTNSHWVIFHDVKEAQVGDITVRTLIGKDPWKLTWSTTSGITSKDGTISIPVKEQNFLNPENFALLADISKDQNLMIVKIPIPEMKYALRHRDNIQQAARIASRLQVVAPEKVLAILNADLKNHGISIPRGLTPNRPLLVKVLEKYRPDYYLVTYQDKDGDASFVARADAYTGELIDSLKIDPIQLPLTNSSLSPATAITVAMARIPADSRLKTGRRKAFVNELGRVATASEGDQQLVWRPCPESESAFFPFFQVTDGSNQSFVRIDGKPFKQLSVKVAREPNLPNAD